MYVLWNILPHSSESMAQMCATPRSGKAGRDGSCGMSSARTDESWDAMTSSMKAVMEYVIGLEKKMDMSFKTLSTVEQELLQMKQHMTLQSMENGTVVEL